MIKYFCDGCGRELPEPYCLYTTNYILCDTCYPKFIKKFSVGHIVILPALNTKLDLNGDT